MALARDHRRLLFRYCPADPRFCKRFPACHGLRALGSSDAKYSTGLPQTATRARSRRLPFATAACRSVLVTARSSVGGVHGVASETSVAGPVATPAAAPP